MNRIVNFLQKYFAVISILIGISIVLSMTFSNYIVSSNSHKAAEMYIGELKYSVEIDGSLNTLTVPKGETVVDVRVSNLNPVDTYYKLLYLKNSNITIKYYESTKDTDEVITTYSKPNDSIKGNNSNYIKLIITNNSTTTQNVALTMKGGYITNTIDDIIVPSTYSDITEIESTKTNTYFCKTDASLEQGLKYVNGQFTYAYKQQGASSTSGLGWTNINSNGWGVQLTDKTSTDAVTSKFCTYINNKPTTSTVMMFYNSKAGSIDFTNFDTSKVTNMASMFYETQTPVLDVSNFDTSRVINMYCMFYKTIATTLDVSRFNTSKVYNMRGMFGESKVTSLDLTNFDTSKVTNMKSMFYKSNVTTLNLSNFNTAKVTDMSYMFGYASATALDLSNFDTRNVTNMNSMFTHAKATTLDISSFDTSKVTDMSYMFQTFDVDTLELTNFNTSNVTNMKYMFAGNNATKINVNSFDTNNVTDMSLMFASSKATILDVSNFDTSNVTNMGNMFSNTQVVSLDLSGFNTSNVTDMSSMFSNYKGIELDVSSFNTSNVTNMKYMFGYSSNLETIYASDKFVTTNVNNSDYMFMKDTNLVGGSGTTYNSSYVDKTYARIDGGTSNPGYFTDINNQPSTFSTDDWTTIISSVKSRNTRGYKVGETKEVSLGTTYGTHTLRIANTSTPSDCSTEGFSQTACGFVLEFTDSVTNSAMNSGSTDTNVGGWNSSLVRTLVNGKIYNALPSDLKKGIINTTVVSGHGEDDKSNFSSTDKLYLLSPIEVWSYDNSDNAIKTDTSRFLTRQLDYYASIGVTTSNYSGAIKKNDPSLNFDWWWLRSAYSKDAHTFFAVKPNGDWFWIGTRSNYTGISPAFRIG